MSSLRRSALTGDITAPAGSNVTELNPAAPALVGLDERVTVLETAPSPLPDIAQGLLGNPDLPVAAPELVELGGGLEFDVDSLRRSALTGDVTAPAGSNLTVLNPAAPALVGLGERITVLETAPPSSLPDIAQGLLGNPDLPVAPAALVGLGGGLEFTGGTPTGPGSSGFPFVDDWDPGTAGADHDSVMIQAAIDAIAAAGGGELWLRTKTYNCTVAPQVPKQVHLRGQGMDATIIKSTGIDQSVIRTKDADGLYGVGALSITGMTLQATSAQLYGLLGRGADHCQFDRLRVNGLTATTGSGWNGLEGAWGFYLTSFTDGLGASRKSSGNMLSNLMTKTSPNSLCLASPTGLASDGSGGLNNVIMRAVLTGFLNTGMDLFGEATTVISANLSANVDNCVGVRVRDAVTTLIGVDSDSTFGASIGGGTDAWGYPLGVRNNNNTGFYFYDASSAIVLQPTGNGCRKRVDFQSIAARNGVVFLRADYHSISALVTGIPQASISYTADHILNFADMGKLVRMVVDAPNNVTVPVNSDVPFPVNAKIELYQYGVGAMTIVAGVGVTILKVSSLVSPGRYYRAILHQVLANTWTLNWMA